MLISVDYLQLFLNDHELYRANIYIFISNKVNLSYMSNCVKYKVIDYQSQYLAHFMSNPGLALMVSNPLPQSNKRY